VINFSNGYLVCSTQQPEILLKAKLANNPCQRPNQLAELSYFRPHDWDFKLFILFENLPQA
ncbi:MAG: hypothetical protein ACI9EW_004208, partial [Cellvibrionaceae bacterium]